MGEGSALLMAENLEENDLSSGLLAPSQGNPQPPAPPPITVGRPLGHSLSVNLPWEVAACLPPRTRADFKTPCRQTRAFLVAQLVKNPPAMLETPVRFLGGEDPLEEDMENPMDRGAWRATARGVPRLKSQTRLKRLSTEEPTHELQEHPHTPNLALTRAALEAPVVAPSVLQGEPWHFKNSISKGFLKR